jgi:hypothetical protein
MRGSKNKTEEEKHLDQNLFEKTFSLDPSAKKSGE